LNKGVLEKEEIKAFEELRDSEKTEELLEIIYNLLEKDLKTIKKEYRKFLGAMIKKRDKKRVIIKLSIKPFASFKSKVIERKKSIYEVKDLVRATMLLCSDDEVKKLYNDIIRKKLEVIAYTYKEMGEDKKFGYYGSYHIIFFFNGLNVELQIMTRKLWNYKDEAHKLYNKYRDKSSIDQEDLRVSKMIFYKGNQARRDYKHSEIRRNYKVLIRYFRGS